MIINLKLTIFMSKFDRITTFLICSFLTVNVQAQISTQLFPAAGSMRASGDDMLKFLSAALTLPGTPSEIKNAMRITQTPYYVTANYQQGLAWMIYPLATHRKTLLLNPPLDMDMGPLPAKQLDHKQQHFNKHALIDKTGASDGFRSYIAIIPERKSGIVILANRFVMNGEVIKVGREILLKGT